MSTLRSRAVKDFKKIFLDTSPIIYLLDSDKNFGEKTAEIFSQLSEQNVKFFSSVITIEEYLVYPYRKNNELMIKSFWDLVTENKIILYSINWNEANKAAKIRAEYKFFKPMDALQLAVASLHGCDLFLTNDKQLKQFQEISCVTVEEWQI